MPAKAVALVVLVVLVWAASRLFDDRLPDRGGETTLAAFLSSQPGEQFRPVSAGRAFSFPGDHGAHPDYRQEWWYFTGNLVTDRGREFGYQLTFFRFGQPRFGQLEKTGWNSGQAWMSHFAITDVADRRFIADEDFARQAAGLAGARVQPFRVWVNDRSASRTVDACSQCFAVSLKAQTDAASIDLDLHSTLEPVLQGDKGYSVKSPDGAVASYYYSMPFLNTSGEISMDGERFQVEGKSWMDREWSSAVLAKGQAGWDWFALHFNDGRGMMLYQVREFDDESFKSGMLIGDDNSQTPLDALDLSMVPTGWWTSPATGSRYPTEWQIRIGPAHSGLELAIEPMIADQELNLAFRYYEGAVRFHGTDGGKPVSGVGYMELTGYEPGISRD